MIITCLNITVGKISVFLEHEVENCRNCKTYQEQLHNLQGIIKKCNHCSQYHRHTEDIEPKVRYIKLHFII